MKSLPEISHFYMHELMPELEVLEKKRKTKVQRIAMINAPILFTALLIAFFTRGSHGAAGFSIVIGLIASGIVYSIHMRGYVNDFKVEVIKRIVEFVDPALVYQQDRRVSLHNFKKSCIFQAEPDRYRGDDKIEGMIGDTRVQFSEIHAEYESDNEDNRSYSTIFKGLFFVGDFNKNFKGETFVFPDRVEKIPVLRSLSHVFQSMSLGRPELVKLEDPEFESQFVVYSSDQTEARYILSPALMRRILDFKLKTKRPIYLSFTLSDVYVAVSYSRDLFEPRIFKTVLDFDQIRQYFEDLQLAIGIVEDLNLNTRIWTKE